MQNEPVATQGTLVSKIFSFLIFSSARSTKHQPAMMHHASPSITCLQRQDKVLYCMIRANCPKTGAQNENLPVKEIILNSNLLSEMQLPLIIFLLIVALTNFSVVTSWQPNVRGDALIPRLTNRRATRNYLSSRDDDLQDPVLRLPLMEAELATLSSDKDSSELETAIGDAKTAAEFGVRKSQLEFYDAFSKGDIEAMGRVWSTQSHVRCVHPGMSSLEGRDAVMESWKQLFSSSGGGKSFSIEPARVSIDICGLTAICSCIEKTEGGGELEALNIYKREDGSWRMTLHMAGPIVMQRGSSAFF